MILVTVGTQLPFNRLISTVDQWASERMRTDFFAQIGISNYYPKSIPWARFLPPNEFEKRLDASMAVVSHAGIGSILSALELGKPVIILPRRAELNEHRNDHQLATAKRFQHMELVSVAFDEQELKQRLDEIESSQSQRRFPAYAPPHLLNSVRQFISSRP